MNDPLSIQALQPGVSVNPTGGVNASGASTAVDGKNFKETLLNSLDEVNRLQQEATSGVEQAMTGQTDNLTEVFTAVRKADVAFSMLMEMRNKLVDAYREIQQMKV